MPVDSKLNSTANGKASGDHSSLGMLQLCVIVAKDESGYGLTVSGDKPVHVQKVKKDGAADVAGVREGDRILKVNSSHVSNLDHSEVVQLIKSGPHVALTLLRKPDSKISGSIKSPTSPANVHSSTPERIGAPIPASLSRRSSKAHSIIDTADQEQLVAKEKIVMFQKMLTEALSNEEKAVQEYAKNKSPKNEMKLTEAKKTVINLKNKLEKLTGFSNNARERRSYHALDSTVSDPDFSHVEESRPFHAAAVLAVGGDRLSTSYNSGITRSRNLSFRVRRSSSDAAFKEPLINRQFLPAAIKRALMMKKGDPVAVSVPCDVADSGSARPSISSMSSPGVLSESVSSTSFAHDSISMRSHSRNNSVYTDASTIIDMDDDEEVLSDIVKDHGPFNELDRLKTKPAHCSVFLHFLISNCDPAPLLFTLIADAYKAGSPRDMKKWAYEIHSTFLLRSSPLPIRIEEDSVISEIETTLCQRLDREEYLKNVFNEAKMKLQEVIREELAEFRKKRSMGLGGFYGDRELTDDMDKNSEQRIINSTLKRDFDKFSSDESTSRSIALAASIATVMKEWGLSGKELERQASFVTKDFTKQGTSIKNYLTGTKQKKNKETVKGHQFSSHSYQSTVFCEICKELLWGVGYQGYNCQNCDMNVNKECLNKVQHCRKTHKKDKNDRKRLSMPWKHNSPQHTSSTTSLVGLVAENSSHSRSRSVGSEDQAINPESADEDSHGAQSTHSVSELRKRFDGEGLVVKDFSVVNEVDSSDETMPKSSVGVNRSESLKGQKKSMKDKSGRRATSDGDKHVPDVLQAINQAHSSSSGSSLSNKSDSSSTEKINMEMTTHKESIEECDSDLEVEDSLPSLESVIPKDVIRKMKPKEKKLQEIINELVYTERSHVRNLKLLDLLFHQPMRRADFCSDSLVDLVFPDLFALISIHVQLNDAIKSKMRENPLISIKHINELLLERMDGNAGEQMKTTCANFCRNHTYAVKFLKERRRIHAKTHDLFNASEANRLCRRLQFKDLIIAEVHRLTKYPLLLESMRKYVPSGSDEHVDLQRAITCSKAILNHVNAQVKECENIHKLEELQKRLDTRPLQNTTNPMAMEYKNLVLTDHKLVYDGLLTWRCNAKKHLDLQAILFENILVLLQVQDDNRLVLKCQSTGAANTLPGKEEGKSNTHSPVIHVNNIICRPVATDKKAFFIIHNYTGSSGPQIYELATNTQEEKKRWFKYITDTATEGRKPTTINRAHVNKSILTLNESSDDLGLAQASTDNNNIDQTTLKPSSETSSLDNEANASPEASGEDARLQMAKAFGIPEHDVDTVVEMASELDEEMDPKSLLLASINGLNEINEIVSLSLSPTALPTSPSPSASLSGSMCSLAPSVSSADTNRIAQISQHITRRLYNLLDLLNEKESKAERLRTAEAILASGAKAESGDSRPNSFISTTSSEANTTGFSLDESVQESTNTYTAEPSAEPHECDTSNRRSSSSDSDEEGTVYADTCEDLAQATTVNPSSTLTREQSNKFIGNDTDESATKDCDSKSSEGSEDNPNEPAYIDKVAVDPPTSDTEENEDDIIDTDNASNNNSNLNHNSPTIDVQSATDSETDDESESDSDSDTVAESPELSESVKAYVEGLITDAVDMVIHNTTEVETNMLNVGANFKEDVKESSETVAEAGDALCMTSLD